MFNHVVGENNFVSELGNSISQQVVIGTIFRQCANPTGLFHHFAAGGHGRTKRELHAFQKFGRHHSGRHLHRHPQRLESRPDASCRHSAIEARNRAHLRIQQRTYDFVNVVRLNVNVAVAEDEVIGRARLDHFFERADFGVRVIRFAGEDHLRIDPRIASLQALHYIQRRIGRVTRAEDDFEIRILLREEAFQAALELRLHTTQRFQQRDPGPAGRFERFTATHAPSKAHDRDERKNQKNRATDKSNQCDGQKYSVKHSGPLMRTVG